jgi:predicted phosphodiesterase
MAPDACKSVCQLNMTGIYERHDENLWALTRWGLLSDIHGNLDALEAALTRLADAGAERLAFLGDYLGRGDSDACVRRIRELADIAIVGNRDLDWQHRVAAKTRDWVLRLPRTATIGHLLLAHGDPRLTRTLSTQQIGRDFTEAWRELDARGCQILAFGHSHHARVWRKPTAHDPAELVRESTLPVESTHRYFVNVGTTGLPFPGKGPPSVALIDLASGYVRTLLVEE